MSNFDQIWSCIGCRLCPMPVYRADLRKHANRLLAIALTARDKGQIECADRLAEQASGVLDTAKTLELVRQRHIKKK